MDDILGFQQISVDRPSSRGSSSFTYNKFLASCNEEARLRSPLSASCRSSFHRSYSSASDVDSVMLQSQVTTLEWQLRQAEASRQMYRAVMEQVVSFLQKTHKNLDLLQNRIDDNDVDDVTRIPRSRSVHAVDSSTPHKFSSPRSETNLSFQKAKSFGQIGDPDCPKHGSMYREMSWRRPRKQRGSDDLTPSKLSEEAFRLLRTVKSLLNTREPDLTSRLNTASTTCSSPANIADVSSASSTVSATLESENSDRFQTRETYLVPRGKDTSSQQEKHEESETKGSPHQLSIGSSADDESGFSSLSSFHDVVSNSTYHHHKHKLENTYPEVGLPRVNETGCKVHRRWSSTPVDGHLPKLRPASLCTNGEPIEVLWV
ncbi:hypothetical protein RUM44_009581 [Polyplax serrata]|uniref:Uncharacterized protein n=1 Tax=Polyplax serrata TaxID=468196 RepID=A0ABR1AT30_POLSC